MQCTSYWNPIQTFKFQACPPRPGRRLRRPAYSRQTHKHSTCCSRAGVCWFARAASQQVLECGVVVECGHSLASETHRCNPLRGYIVLLLATAPVASAVRGAITMSNETRAWRTWCGSESVCMFGRCWPPQHGGVSHCHNSRGVAGRKSA